MSQYPAVIELSNLNGSNGFRINGEAADDWSGWSVSSAGDVNGDGFADLIVSALEATPHGASSGASYVVFGEASGFGAMLELSGLDGSNGFQINGEAAGDQSGFSVSSAGDVNGDGFADLFLGAIGADPNGVDSGASYVVFGKASGFDASLELSSLDGSNGFQINGEAAGDFSGLSVSSAGDMNGDGFADLIVGAPNADPNGSYSGASYVVFGKASGFGASLNLSSLDGSNGFQISGVTLYDRSGRSVASAGDVNGDGFADVIIGAYGADPHGARSGASYVVFSKASGFGATLELSSLNGSNGFQINGETAGDFSGSSVSSAGDINSDGFADLIVGAPGADPNGSYSGASYVVFGRASGFGTTLDLSSLDGSNGFQINGVTPRAGWSVASAGDINGDGFADLIVGAGVPGGNSNAGYVVFGKATGFDATLELSNLDGSNGFQIKGETAGDRAGYSVASAGDIDGDGFADIIVGAPLANTHGSDSGASYVIFGSMPNEAVTRTGTAIANTIHGGKFDDTLSGLGGDDILFGHGGNDILDGGTGNDTMSGGGGNDTFVGGAGNDAMNGGSGHNVIDYSADTQGVSADLALGTATGAGVGSDILVHIADVFGGAGNDSLSGDKKDNLLVGGAGKDVLRGQRGDDTLSGGAGRDTLIGGLGADLLNGGTSRDHFKYGDASASGGSIAAQSTGSSFDTITGFSQHDTDQFVLWFAVTGIDATVAGGHMSKATADADLSTAITAGALDVHHALLFTPTTGDQQGDTFLIVDANGVAGYQAGQDLVIRLDAPVALAHLTTADFS